MKQHSFADLVRDAVRQIIGPHGAVIGMERLQRLGTDRRQAQAALAADPLGAGERFLGMGAVVMGMAAFAGLVRGMGMVAMAVGVRLHFGHVALRRVIGQRAAILSGRSRRGGAALSGRT